MSFLVGQRIRFGAKFRDEAQRLFDPAAVQATVTMGGRTETYTIRTGIRRRSAGDYFLELVLTASGQAVVTFASVGDGEEAVQRASYAVSGSGLAVPEITATQPAPFAPRADEVTATARAMLLADIAAAGIPCDTSRSDAYLSAVLAEHRRQEGDDHRRANHERTRASWKRT